MNLIFSNCTKFPEIFGFFLVSEFFFLVHNSVSCRFLSKFSCFHLEVFWKLFISTHTYFHSTQKTQQPSPFFHSNKYFNNKLSFGISETLPSLAVLFTSSLITIIYLLCPARENRDTDRTKVAKVFSPQKSYCAISMSSDDSLKLLKRFREDHVDKFHRNAIFAAC